MIRTVTAHFNSNDRYFENSIGNEYHFTSLTGPYEYLLGALAGCFYSTLAGFERHSNWESVDIKVIGDKREDSVPTTLKNTTLAMTVHKAEDRNEFEKLVERAQNACSIYATISQVSEMSVTIEFKD